MYGGSFSYALGREESNKHRQGLAKGEDKYLAKFMMEEAAIQLQTLHALLGGVRLTVV